MLTTSKIGKIQGRISVPGDKSISHRALMLLAISRGKGRISGFLRGADCLSTMACLEQLGLEIEDLGSELVVYGQGLHGLRRPHRALDVGNSGTTMRLLSGILAGQKFPAAITGDHSIQTRPMDRIAIPLRMMGAVIEGKAGRDLAPLLIQGRNLQGIDYTLPVASAQVKSAILLAGLYAEGETVVREPKPSRNHTELMLAALGAEIESKTCEIRLRSSELQACDLQVPGDISSAAFFITPAAAMPGSHLIVKDVGLNPSRTGIIDVLKDMGAGISLENVTKLGGELRGNVVVRGGRLRGTVITGEMIPRLIDEIPVLAVVASQAEGTTTITGAEELRVKESDRISVLVQELGKLGVDIQELADGMQIKGPCAIQGAEVHSHGDHRLAMALAVLGLFSREPVKVRGSECIDVSFPGFEKVLGQIIKY